MHVNRRPRLLMSPSSGLKHLYLRGQDGSARTDFAYDAGFDAGTIYAFGYLLCHKLSQFVDATRFNPFRMGRGYVESGSYDNVDSRCARQLFQLKRIGTNAPRGELHDRSSTKSTERLKLFSYGPPIIENQIVGALIWIGSQNAAPLGSHLNIRQMAALRAGTGLQQAGQIDQQ